MRRRLLGSTLLVALSVSAAGIGVAGAQSGAKPSRYLYVWAGTGNPTTKGVNSLVVIDADPASAKYGTIINALTVDTAGNMPHHTEFELPKSGSFVANDYGADRSYLIDFSNPANPRLTGQTGKVPKGHMVHSFARLPGGNILGTVQHGDPGVEGHPGGLAEFDNSGKLIRYTSSQDPEFPGAHIRTYALTTLPAFLIH